jgi:penicillin-binding protein 1A
LYEELSETTIVLDDKGKTTDRLYIGDGEREIISYKDIPKDVINAFIAIEDKTFKEHHGFNFIRLGGAILKSITGGGNISGTSTITQQLARNIWLHDSMTERSIFRKLREAYITVQLERKLSKTQIITAYLNTISLGNRSYGIQAAAKNYFSKSVKDLDLVEASLLAALPKSPTSYSYVKSYPKAYILKETKNTYKLNIPVEDGFVTQKIRKDDILKETEDYFYVYNDIAVDRQKLDLSLMLEEKFITKAEYKEAIKVDVKKKMKPQVSSRKNTSSYFSDYLVSELKKDLVKNKHISEERAETYIFQGGLKIKSTMSSSMQKTVHDKLEDAENYMKVVLGKRDKEGNILNKKGNIIVFRYDNYFDSEDEFVLGKDEYELNKDGTLILKKNKRLNFYNTEYNGMTEINIEFPKLYKYKNDDLYMMDGGVLNIPAGYKTRLVDGNIEIDKAYSEEKAFKKTKEGLVFPRVSYTLRDEIIQPQAAMVIIDSQTGQIKAMQGGRNIKGNFMYNRAISPRQPGSAIKPLSVYSPALQKGADKIKIKNGENSFGEYWTAASAIDDKKMTFQGKTWPKNWYSGYKGYMTLRKAVEQSVNTIAVQVQLNIGNTASIDMLKKFGITTLETKNSTTNDLNPAALALGGMTNGLTPLEITSAYSTFANKGFRITPIAYTEVLDSRGNTILKNKQEKIKVVSEETAFLMNNILRSVVTNGLAAGANISSQPVAGKTGTTNDNFDIWFVGNTPKYAAGLWMGNDINLELTASSDKATAVWASIMSKILDGTKKLEFPSMPAGIEKKKINGLSEYFVKGTAPTHIYNAIKAKETTEEKKKKKEKQKEEEEENIEPPPPPEEPETETESESGSGSEPEPTPEPESDTTSDSITTP